MTVSIIGNFSSARDAAGRLVEQQQLGPPVERHRDVEQLAHAAGQLGDAAVAVLGEAEALEQRLGARRPPRRRCAGCQKLRRASWQALATSMLSSTVRSPQSCGIWNERADAEARDRARRERA